MPVTNKITANRVRMRILAERGLAPKTGGGLRKGLPESEINTPLARLLEFYYKLSIRSILELPREMIFAETGVNRTTLWRWQQELD